MKIGWCLPDVKGTGSGGIKTIIDIVKYLSKFHDQVLTIPHTDRPVIEHYYGNLPDNVTVQRHFDDDYDLLIATWWETAKAVRLASAKHRAYFIQDSEYMFYPASSNYYKAKETYSYGLTPITMGRWLGKHFESSYSIDFCVDTDIYKDLGKQKDSLCFLYQPQKPHRLAEIGLEALKIVKQSLPELKIWCYGSNPCGDDEKRYPEFDFLGQLSLTGCNLLYNKCKLGVCFSATNPSRIPFEMMSAGCQPLDINNYDDYNGSVFVSKPNVNIIAQNILKHFGKTLPMDTPKSLDYASEQFTQIVGAICA